MKSQKAIEEEVKETILSELALTEESLDEAVENLKAWLDHQPHLPHVIDLTMLRKFILSCRTIDKAKEKLNNYFMARINTAAILSNRYPTNFDWDCIQPVVYLPDLTPDGDMVLLITIPDFTSHPRYDSLQFYRYVTMMWEVVIRERPYVTSLLCLVDNKNYTFKFLMKLSIRHTANAIYLFDRCYPMVLKAIHMINTPKAVHSLFSTLIKPIMPESLYKRVNMYKEDSSIIEQHIPTELLPRDYGGNAPSLNDLMDDWRLKMDNSNDLFSGECSHLPEKPKK